MQMTPRQCRASTIPVSTRKVGDRAGRPRLLTLHATKDILPQTTFRARILCRVQHAVEAHGLCLVARCTSMQTFHRMPWTSPCRVGRTPRRHADVPSQVVHPGRYLATSREPQRTSCCTDILSRAMCHGEHPVAHCKDTPSPGCMSRRLFHCTTRLAPCRTQSISVIVHPMDSHNATLTETPY